MQVDSYIHNTLKNAMQQELPFIGKYKLIIKTRILREINTLITIVGIAVVSISCFPIGAEYIDELDIVYTYYDDSYNFKNKHTFAVPCKVIKIDQENVPDGPSFEPESKEDSLDTIPTIIQ